MANASLDPIDILLELGFDLDDISDDESYLSAMKEAIATIEFKTQGKGDDRSRALRDEVIKVTRQRRSKRTVDVNKVFKTKPKASTVAGPKLLAASKDYKEQKEEEEKQEKAVTAIIPAGLKRVSDGINDITKVLVRDLTAEKKQADEERKAAENLAAETEEKESEKQSQESAGNFLKGLKPPEIPFFDRIKQFFGNVLAGGLLSWLAKDENKDKVQGFADFIRDHGGKILTGILALVALDVGMKLLGFLKLFTPLVKGMLLLFKNPVFLTLLAALGVRSAYYSDVGGVRSTAEGAMVEGIREGYKRDYGEGNAGLGQFTTQMRQQYGSIAGKEEYEKMTDEEKTTAQFLKLYDDELRNRQKINDELFRLNSMKDDLRVRPKIEQKTKELADSDAKLRAMESQIQFGDKSFTEAFEDFQSGGVAALPQTSLSQRLYPSQAEMPNTGTSGYLFGDDYKTKQELSKMNLSNQELDEEGYSMKGASFSYDETLEMSEESKQIIHGAPEAPPSTKPDDLTPEFKALEIHPESKRIQQELFSTPPKPMQVSVLPVSVPAKKPQVASSSAGQKTAPTFGSVDPNNTSVPMIAGVYNSPVAV